MSTAAGIVTARVSIEGKPPGLLMASKRIMEAQEGHGKKGVTLARDQEAELHCHWTTVKGKKQLAIPWTNLYKSICEAAGQFKFRGQKTMAAVVAATIACDVDMIPLGTDDYEVYVEWVRIPPRTGAMVQMGRPRLRAWSASFNMLVDSELYGKGIGVLREIINHAGKMVGIGPWRPALKGPYGRFAVTAFDVKE